MKEPALGLLELKSVAKGITATDAICKKAPVRILETHPICPGKYMILFGGEVGDVDEAIRAGSKRGGDGVVNQLFIPYLHEMIIPSIVGTRDIEKFDAIAVVETFSIASCVVAADIAAKTTPVELVEIRLAQGLGGKGYFVMTGSLPDIEAATDAAKEYIRSEGMLAGCEVIASPHPDLIERGIYW